MSLFFHLEDVLMTRKPIYEELEQIVKEFEKETIKRRQVREAPMESEQRLLETSAMLECSKAVLIHSEFEQAARVIFDLAKNLIGATAGYVALLSKDGMKNEVLFLEAGGHPCTVDLRLPMPIRGLRARSYRTGEVVFENSFSNSKWMAFMPKGHVTLDNVMFAPLKIDGKAYGLIGLANKIGGFTENDARMATEFGKFTAIALEKAWQ